MCGHSPDPWLRNDVASLPGEGQTQRWQGSTLLLGSSEIQVAYSGDFLATSLAFRGSTVRFTLVPKFIWDWSLNCYKFRLNLNFSAEPGRFPQEPSFWMDLKIQHSCRLTTSQLKGSGFGSLQSDPHCALHYSTAAVIPTRRGSAEAVMTLHFFEMPVIMPLAGKKYGQSTCCKGGQGGYVRVICKRHNWTQVISELSNKELCSIGALLGFRKGLSAFI